MPAPARPRPTTSKLASIENAELDDPAPDSLIGHVEAALSQQVFDVPIAERETQVEPHGPLDDVGWKPVAGVGDLAHRQGLCDRPRRRYAVLCDSAVQGSPSDFRFAPLSSNWIP